MSADASGAGAGADAAFGENARCLRRVRGLTLRDVHEKTGLSVSCISSVEHGRGTTLKTASAIAEALGSSLSEMLSEEFLGKSMRSLSAVPVDMQEIRSALARPRLRKKAGSREEA